jgi:hypothetical protein
MSNACYGVFGACCIATLLRMRQLLRSELAGPLGRPWKTQEPGHCAVALSNSGASSKLQVGTNPKPAPVLTTRLRAEGLPSRNGLDRSNGSDKISGAVRVDRGRSLGTGGLVAHPATRSRPPSTWVSLGEPLHGDVAHRCSRYRHSPHRPPYLRSMARREEHPSEPSHDNPGRRNQLAKKPTLNEKTGRGRSPLGDHWGRSRS